MMQGKKTRSNEKKTSQLQSQNYIVVGRLRRPHGLHGEILMDIFTDFPERFQPEEIVYMGEHYKEIHIHSVRWHQQFLLISFDEYQDCEEVGQLRNQMLYVKKDFLPELPDGEYYHHQLIGLTVIDSRNGKELGILNEIIQTGANDVYVVGFEENQEILLPAIEDVILNVDLAEKRMSVNPPEWW